MNEELTKVCSSCREEKLLSEFHKKKSGKYGVNSVCKECSKVYIRKYYIDNKDSIKEQVCNYYLNNKEYICGQKKQYYQKNKEHYNVYRVQYYKDNRDIILENNRLYYKNNKHIHSEKKAKRRALKLNQTPVLTTEEQQTIKLYYKLSTVMGSGYHVDHIIPLNKGGLHHPNNLQILYASDNLSKSDKLDYTYIHARYIIQNNQLIKISGAKND